MKFALILLALLSPHVFAAEEMDEKFDLLCEWKVGTVHKAQKYHVNAVDHIVDGQITIFHDNSLTFVRNNIEHKIDLNTGLVETRSLKGSASSQSSEIRECRKVAAPDTTIVRNVRKS